MNATQRQPPRICFDLRAGHYVVLDGDTQRTTRDLVEAVAWADPDGTGIVQCDAITERHMGAFCDAPAPSQPASLDCVVAPPAKWINLAFRSHYKCRCGNQWEEQQPAVGRNDKCGYCRRSTPPFDSERIVA